MENVTNVLNTASSVLSQTLATTSPNKGNAPNSGPKATTIGGRRGPKLLPRDFVTGKIIRPRDSEGNLIIKQRKTSKNKENLK